MRIGQSEEERRLSFEIFAERWKADVPWLNELEEATAATKEAIIGRAILKMNGKYTICKIAYFLDISEDYVKKVIEEGPQDWWDTY